MSSRTATLENKWKVRYYSGQSRVSTAIITAKDHKRAERKAQLMFKGIHGIIGISKLSDDYERIERKELKIMTERIIEDNRNILSPLAMDEFIWLRRNKRIENRSKDKLDK
jgi:hypothetical protein